MTQFELLFSRAAGKPFPLVREIWEEIARDHLEELTKLIEEHAECDDAKSELRSAISDLEGDLRESRNETDEARARHDTLASELAEARDELAAAEKELETLRAAQAEGAA